MRALLRVTGLKVGHRSPHFATRVGELVAHDLVLAVLAESLLSVIDVTTPGITHFQSSTHVIVIAAASAIATGTKGAWPLSYEVIMRGGCDRSRAGSMWPAFVAGEPGDFHRGKLDAELTGQRFFSLAELDAAIASFIAVLNARGDAQARCQPPSAVGTI